MREMRTKYLLPKFILERNGFSNPIEDLRPSEIILGPRVCEYLTDANMYNSIAEYNGPEYP
jgi:hypothetical protein